MLYKTLESAEQVASREYGEVVKIGNQWIIKPILLDKATLADLLGCCERTVDNMREQGRLPGTAISTPGAICWRLRDIMAMS